MKVFAGLLLLLSFLAVTHAQRSSFKGKQKFKRPEPSDDREGPEKPEPRVRRPVSLPRKPAVFQVEPEESSGQPEVVLPVLPKPPAPPKLAAISWLVERPELPDNPKIAVRPKLPKLPVITRLPEEPELIEDLDLPELPELTGLPERPELLEDPELTGLPEEPGLIPPPDIRDPIEPIRIHPPPLPLLPLYGFSKCKEAPRLSGVQQIDAGLGMVVARTNRNRAFFLSGSNWHSLAPFTFRHVSVGPAGLWGVDIRHRVYKYVAGNFRAASGVSMQQVDAGGDGHVVGVSTSNFQTFCLRSSSALAYRGVGSLSWSPYKFSMRYYSCGPYSCWGVDTRSRVYVTQKIASSNCGFAAWRQVPGINMRMIEVGTDGGVYGVATNGLVYRRIGVHKGRQEGSSWFHIPVCMPVKHVSYDLDQLWVVTNSGLLLQCSR